MYIDQGESFQEIDFEYPKGSGNVLDIVGMQGWLTTKRRGPGYTSCFQLAVACPGRHLQEDQKAEPSVIIEKTEITREVYRENLIEE